MKFGICSEIFQEWSFDRACGYAAKVGYDVIEIAPFTIAKYVTEISTAKREEVRATAARAGIAISGIHWVLAQTEGLHLTHPDASIRERTARYFIDLVDFCADLGGTRIIVGSPKQRNRIDGVTPDQAWAWAKTSLRSAIQRAEDREVVICIEPLSPMETNFLNTAAEAHQFAAEFGSKAISIILDVKAMWSEGRPIPDIIRENAGKFAYFHANDPNLKGPGFGDMDFHPIAAALRDAGYDDIVSVEVFKFEEGPEAIATKSIECLRRVFARETPA